MIRVLQVMEATIGGTRKHLGQLALGLDRRSFEVTVACAALRQPGFRQDIAGMRAAGVRVVEIEMRRQIDPRSDLAATARLRRLIGEGFDIVHTHSSKAGVVGRLAGRRRGGPALVHTPHSFAFLHSAEFSATRRRLFLGIERWLGRFTTRLIAVSQAEAEITLAHRIVDADRVRTVRNGIEPDLERRARAAAGVERLGLANGDRAIGSVGLLEVAKGHEVLIAALPRVLAEFPRLKCFLIGEGSLRRRLERQAAAAGVESSVIFTGHRDDTLDLMSALEAVVLPSLWEGLPYVLLEAMALGKPVVASDVGGCGEVVADGETGLLVPANDPRALASAISDLLRHRERAADMGTAARPRASSRFGVEAMIAGHEAIYRELALRHCVGGSTRRPPSACCSAGSWCRWPSSSAPRGRPPACRSRCLCTGLSSCSWSPPGSPPDP